MYKVVTAAQLNRRGMTINVTPSQAALILRGMRAERAQINRSAKRGRWHSSEVAAALADVDRIETLLTAAPDEVRQSTTQPGPWKPMIGGQSPALKPPAQSTKVASHRRN